MPDRLRRLRDFLARVLPWFDARQYERERAASRQAIARAERVLAGRPQHRDRIRKAYRAYGDGMKR